MGLLRDKRVSGLVLEDVRTGARRELACEGIFVAIGRVPDTELFRGQVELDEQGYIKADETHPHGLPGVFAVGDVRTKPLRQIVTATADGRRPPILSNNTSWKKTDKKQAGAPTVFRGGSCPYPFSQ